MGPERTAAHQAVILVATAVAQATAATAVAPVTAVTRLVTPAVTRLATPGMVAPMATTLAMEIR